MLSDCCPLCLHISIFDVRLIRMCFILDCSQGTTVTAPSYNANGQYTALILVFSFLVGLFCCMLYLAVDNFYWLTQCNSVNYVLSNRSRRLYNVSCISTNINGSSILYRFVGLGEDPEVLAIRAPNLFAVRVCAY